MNKKLTVTIKDVKNVDCKYPDTKIYIEENLNLNSFLISVMTILLYLSFHIFHSFSKNCIIHQLKNTFFSYITIDISIWFISVHGLYGFIKFNNYTNFFKKLIHDLMYFLNFLCVKRIQFYHVN